MQKRHITAMIAQAEHGMKQKTSKTIIRIQYLLALHKFGIGPVPVLPRSGIMR